MSAKRFHKSLEYDGIRHEWTVYVEVFNPDDGELYKGAGRATDQQAAEARALESLVRNACCTPGTPAILVAAP